MRSFNLFDGELDSSRDRPGFSWRRAAVGEHIGAAKMGASLYELRPGDVVCFREGPEGAHQVRNDTGEPVKVLILSTKVSPDTAVYPDSGKVGVWSGRETDSGRIFRIADEADYWDGET